MRTAGWTAGAGVAFCPGALVASAGAVTVPRAHVLHAPTDQQFADELALRLIDWGMVVSGAGPGPAVGLDVQPITSDGLRGASVVILLLSAEAMDDPSVQHDAATAVAGARLNPTMVILPVLLDPGADPDVDLDATFVGHPWLVPSPLSAAEVARRIFEALHPSAERPPPQSVPTPPLQPEDHAEALTEVRAAMARPRSRRRAMVAAVVLLVTSNVALVALMVATHGGGLTTQLPVIISPLLTFVGVVLGFRLGRGEMSYRRSRDQS